MPAFTTPLRPPNSIPRRPPSVSPRRPVATASRSNAPPPPLILGLNVYTHDTSIAVLHARTGVVLFALSKERLTRRKHDAGDAAKLTEHALSALSANLAHPVPALTAAITHVVANNHHFRIGPYEKRLPLQVALRYADPATLSPWNLIGSPAAPHPRLAPDAVKAEVSHHLAHAFSAVHHAPFHTGLVVVMDGMGDALHDWQRAVAEDDTTHHSEESVSDDVCQDDHKFRQFPQDLYSRKGTSFREAETAYTFRRDARTGVVRLKRVYKRWTPENAPSELPNHSFEEMESVGAVYSRLSGILFRDWNSCGKVMGLAPYGKKRNEDGRYFMHGDLFDGSLRVNDGHLKGLGHISKSYSDSEPDSELRFYFEDMAYHVQKDLENVVTTFIDELRTLTGERNLVFAGGVALNSTVNGILNSRRQFDQFYIPPYPGDEGICIGCAAFAFSHLQNLDNAQLKGSNPVLSKVVMPYFGKEYSKLEVLSAIRAFEPWIKWERANEVEETVQALTRQQVVAWFQGRSEFGPRALGNRSFLASPRYRHTTDHINNVIKKREAFRPFAPSVLAEHSKDWFICSSGNSSPFMSMTLSSQQAAHTQATTHVDGTSRLQTVTVDQNPTYHRLISGFGDVDGIPMILNTSFNVAGEPIVESPCDALRTFLSTDGVAMLAFPGIIVKKRVLTSLVPQDILSSSCSSFRSHQVQDGFGSSIRTSVTYIPRSLDESTENEPEAFIEEVSIELLDSFELEILELLHSRESMSVEEVYEAMLTDELMNEEASAAPTAQDIHTRLLDLNQQRLIFKQ